MYNIQDNIVALSTVPGKSALNVVRCSGPGIVCLYEDLTQSDKSPSPNYAHLKTIYYKKEIIDEVMLTFFAGPKSFTGQDMLELSTHGGIVVVKKIISLIENFGFRQAMPGEYSYRAFIHGKIDLIQAESIASIVDSGNNLDVLYSLNNLKGGLSKAIKTILSKTENIITHIEHELDFDEGEIDFVALKEYEKQLNKIIDLANDINAKSYLAQENKSNFNICLAGRTNAGKSSLFNCLLGYDRSIVTKQEGTTRDTVEAELVINDINVTLVDTAGIRKATNLVEKEGVSRTCAAIKDADIVVFVDEKNPRTESKKHSSLLKNKNLLFVQSKADLGNTSQTKKTLQTSSTTKAGIDSLFTELSTKIDKHLSFFKKTNLFLINGRQRASLAAFVLGLQHCVKISKKTKDLVLLVSSLRKTYEDLSSLVQNKDRDQIINNIFKGFCVGK